MRVLSDVYQAIKLWICMWVCFILFWAFQVFALEESSVIEEFWGRIAAWIESEDALDDVLNILQRIEEKYDDDMVRKEVVSAVRQSIVSAYYRSMSQKQIQEWNELYFQYNDLISWDAEFIKVYPSLVPPHDEYIAAYAGDDCTRTFNEYINQEVVQCTWHTYKKVTNNGDTYDLWMYPWLNTFVYNHKTDLITAWINAIPYTDTLPITQWSFTNVLDGNGSEVTVFTPYSLWLQKSNEIQRGFADVFFLPYSQKLLVVPRYWQVEYPLPFVMKTIDI